MGVKKSFFAAPWAMMMISSSFERPKPYLFALCNKTLLITYANFTLTYLDSSCPRSLLKTTPPPPGYPWVSRGQRTRTKNPLKKSQIWSKTTIFGRFLSSSSSKPWWSSTKPLNLGFWITYGPLDTHEYPGGGGVVFSKDPGQLESRSVSV